METGTGRETPGEEHREGGKVLRFHWSERALHWALAVPYMVCLGTALVLVVYYNLAPSRPHREVVSWIHRVGGLALIVLPALVLVGSGGDVKIHLRNIRQAWGWTFADLKWLALLALSALTDRVRLPEQGKFNAGEKLNFMAVMTTYPLFILTGILIWLPGPPLLAWLAHFVLALAIAPLVIGHLYMALINPGTRKGLSGMISGYVDRGWAREHYEQWYRESFSEDRDGPAADPPGATAPAHFGAGVHHFGASGRAALPADREP